jgi:hypothetical protein
LNTFGVCFLLRQNKTADDQGRFPIYAKISVNNSKAELSTRVYVKPCHWNKGKGCIKPLTNDLKEQSTHLEKVRAKLTAIFRDMELNDEHLHDPVAIKNEEANFRPLPVIINIDEHTLAENFNIIRNDVRDIITVEMDKIRNNPAFKQTAACLACLVPRK